MEIDQSDYRGHFLQGRLHLFADNDHELALVELERALADNPNDTYVLYYMGFLKFLMGQAEEAIKWHNKAKRINPRYPGWYNYNHALAYVWVKDYEKALVLAGTGIAANPKSLPPRRILIVTLVEMGRLEEAKQQATEFLAIRPDFRFSTFHNTPFKHQADQDRYFNAMRKAGIPD
jgi:tetratricopeptide (TPR) repeat protein